MFAGATFTSGRINAAAAADPTPDHFTSGFGFDVDGKLVIATGAPAGAFYTKGFRQSAKGALYGIASVSISTYNAGLPMSANGQVNYENAAAATFVNGVGISADQRLAVSL